MCVMILTDIYDLYLDKLSFDVIYILCNGQFLSRTFLGYRDIREQTNRSWYSLLHEMTFIFHRTQFLHISKSTVDKQK